MGAPLLHAASGKSLHSRAMQTSSETQIRDLTAQLLAPLTRGTADPARPLVLAGTHDKIRAAALALALPDPATSREASEQIDALKLGGAGLMTYARAHRDWARPVIDRLTAAWGTGYSARPAGITADELSSLANGAS